MLPERHSSSESSGGDRKSRGLHDLAKLDLWGQGEVSATRLLAGWIAFGISLSMAVLLLAGA